jgi:hypothetical protein
MIPGRANASKEGGKRRGGGNNEQNQFAAVHKLRDSKLLRKTFREDLYKRTIAKNKLTKDHIEKLKIVCEVRVAQNLFSAVLNPFLLGFAVRSESRPTSSKETM